MKLKNLIQLYKISKNWDFIDGKLSIPEYDLEKVDVRHEVYPTDNVKGEFLPPMTEDDYIKWQQQKSGWQKFYDKILGKNAD